MVIIKRILLVSCNSLGKGGVQSVMMNIVRNLKDKYIFDIVLFSDGERSYENEFLSYGGKIFRIPIKKSGLCGKFYHYIKGFRVLRNMKKIIKHNGPYNAIHCHNGIDSGACLKAAAKLNVPVRIAHEHIIRDINALHPVAKAYTILQKRKISKYATTIAGCSENACIFAWGNNSNYKVLFNTYDSRFNYNELKTQNNSPVITQVGSFSDSKNQLFTLDVISHIKQRFPETRLNIIGFDLGNILPKMNDKIREFGLEENVVFYNSDAPSEKILEESNYSVCPSKSEAFGIVIIEAQACGVKVFASDVCQKETNCGGVVFLPLSKGADYWAQAIIDDFTTTGGKHEIYDCSAFSKENIMQQYICLYKGK